MLCQFSFSNFRSYRDETTFDFQAAALSEFKDSLIKTEKGNDILPVGVIYGPNGGGKSNLLAALGCVISLVTEPVYELGKNHARFIMQQKVSCVPYLFDEDSREEPSRFQLFFRIGEYFEDKAVEKSRRQIMEAIDLRPETVNLLKSGEMLGMRLAVMHNLYFYNNLMEVVRNELDNGTFTKFYEKYRAILGVRI